MNRRDFVAAAGLSPLAAVPGLASEPKAGNQYFELRHYQPLVGAGRQRLETYLKDAAIPAWNRHGIPAVGVFSVVYGPNAPSLYVLLSHDSLESVATLNARMAADAAYQEAGADFLSAPLESPAFVRFESSLLRAFDAIPRLEVPAEAANNEPRIFELRIYESHSDTAARRKVEMFNAGEIPIFRDTGLNPVFFGETVAGGMMPNLIYMVYYKDMAARDAAWDAFRVHPDWKTLSGNPYYKDTVSNISDYILRPTAYSQV
ncbi:MAG: NIPSNAP family protein [Rhodothermales bacterium]